MRVTAELQARLDIQQELGKSTPRPFDRYEIRISHIFTRSSRDMNKQLLN